MDSRQDEEEEEGQKQQKEGGRDSLVTPLFRNSHQCRVAARVHHTVVQYNYKHTFALQLVGHVKHAGHNI